MSGGCIAPFPSPGFIRARKGIRPDMTIEAVGQVAGTDVTDHGRHQGSVNVSNGLWI